LEIKETYEKNISSAS